MAASASASMVNSAANSPPEADAPDSPRRLLSFGSSGPGHGEVGAVQHCRLPGAREGRGRERRCGGGAPGVAAPEAPVLPYEAAAPELQHQQQRQQQQRAGGRNASSTSSERAPTLERRDSFLLGPLCVLPAARGGHSGGPFSSGSAGIFPATRTDSATEDAVGMRTSTNASARRMGVPHAPLPPTAPHPISLLTLPAGNRPSTPRWSLPPQRPPLPAWRPALRPVYHPGFPAPPRCDPLSGDCRGARWGEAEGALSVEPPAAAGTLEGQGAPQAAPALGTKQSKDTEAPEDPAVEVSGPGAGAQVAGKGQEEGVPGAPGAAQGAAEASEEEGAGAVAETSSQDEAGHTEEKVASVATRGVPVPVAAAPVVATGGEQGVQATPPKAAVVAAPNAAAAAERGSARAPGAHKFQDEVRPRERALGPGGAGGSPGGAPFVVGTAQPRRAPERAPVPGRSPGVGGQRRAPGAHSRPDGPPFTLPAGPGTGAGAGGGGLRVPSGGGAPQQVPWGAGRRDAPRGGPAARPGASSAAAGPPSRAAETSAARAFPSQATPASSAEIQAAQPAVSSPAGAASVTPAGTPGARGAQAARAAPAAGVTPQARWQWQWQWQWCKWWWWQADERRNSREVPRGEVRTAGARVGGEPGRRRLSHPWCTRGQEGGGFRGAGADSRGGE